MRTLKPYSLTFPVSFVMAALALLLVALPVQAITAPAATPSLVSSGAMTIVDSVGRKVQVPTHVNRVISFNSDLTEIIYALGAQDKLVAAGYRTSVGQAWLSDKAPRLARLHSPQSPAGINVEEVLALKPDLIVSTVFGEVGYQEVLKTLGSLGIPIVIVSLERLDTYANDVRIMAKVLGVATRGEELIDFLQQTVSFVQARTKDIPQSERVRVYYSLADVYSPAGGGIFEDDQLRIAGGMNVAASITQFGTQVSAEQIIRWNPQVIITLWEAPAAKVLSDPKLAPIDAVKSHRVYSEPEQGWGFATPRAFFAILWMAKKLYPDRFSDVDLKVEADKFYTRVYGFPYSGPAFGG